MNNGDPEEGIYSMFSLMGQEQEEPLVKDSVAASKHNHEPWFVNIILNGHQVPMEIDTGSAKTVIGEEVFNQIQTGDKEISLVPSETVLSTYSGETISPIGKAEVPVKYGNKEFNLFVEVTKCKTHCVRPTDWKKLVVHNQVGLA